MNSEVSYLTPGGAVTQPGGTVAGDNLAPPVIQHEKPRKQLNSQDVASDKYAIRSFILGDLVAHQLLPVDPQRKRASIQSVSVGAAGGLGILIGDSTSINAFAGNQQATIANSLLIAASGLWAIGNAAFGLEVFEYTSKQGLFCCALTTADVGKTMVQCMVEMFTEGTPIT